MHPQIFVSTTFAPDGTPIGNVLESCQKAGISQGILQGISQWELGSNHAYERDPVAVVRRFPGIYLVHNYFPVPQESLVVNIASSDEDIRQKSIQQVKNSLDFCRTMGAKLYTFHPGFLQDPQGASKASKKREDYDFLFDTKQVISEEMHREARERMKEALHLIVPYAKKLGIAIALETEGSLDKKDFLLMQRPEEYAGLFREFSPQDLKINLNVAHLGLAAKAFTFSIPAFLEIVQPYVVAMELSHNHGKKDDHLPLEAQGWYWDVIRDPRFCHVYKIIEARNTSVEKIKETVDLLEKNLR